jgi:hypothetical protein
MIGVRATFREDSEFSPEEAVFGTQLVLPGQFVGTAESLSPSYRPPWLAACHRRHDSTPAPTSLSKELLLARFVLVLRDSAQPPLAPVYESPYPMLEQSTHLFLLEIGERRGQDLHTPPEAGQDAGGH